MKPNRSPISFAIALRVPLALPVSVALALCAGCAAPRPPVPHRELAERILQPPPPTVEHPLEELPPTGQIGQPSPQSVPRWQRPPSSIGSAERSATEKGVFNLSAQAQREKTAERSQVRLASAMVEPNDLITSGNRSARTADESRRDSATWPQRGADAGGDQLTLATAIDLAYRNNPSIAASRARVDIAQADKDIAYSDFLPQMGMGYRHVVGDTNPSGFVLPTIASGIGNVAFGGSAEEFDMAELRAQWTLWDFGRTTSRFGQSLLAKEIAGLQLVRNEQTVAFDVTSAYFEALSAKAAADIADESIRRAQSTLDDAKNYLNRGNAIRNDVLKADVFLKQMQLELVKANTAYGVAIAKLNRAIGINPSASTEIVELAESPRFEQSMRECLQLAVDNRREFGVVERGIAKAKLGQSEAQAEFRPKVIVGGLGSIEQEHEPTRYAEHASGGIAIELGLYQGGKRVAEVMGSQAEIALAVASGKQVCDQIAYEVKIAFLSLDDAAERVKVAQVETAQASENLRVEKSLLDRGDAIFTDVIEAQFTLTRAQQGYLIATYDYQTALARVAFAVGLPPESFLGMPHR
jgi:outer membrane protein TolC